jgi:predicted regulator of Ras-like GTPase activity (Roadblock/LC7/MglB family)
MATTLHDLLGRFLTISGVRAVVLVGREGLSIEAVGRGDPRMYEALGALGASALGTTEALGQELSTGATIGSLLEYESGLVTVDPVGEYAALVILSDNAGSLSRVRQTLHAARADLLHALDGLP